MSEVEDSVDDWDFSKEYHRKKKQRNKQLEKNHNALKHVEYLQKKVDADGSTDKKTLSKLKSPEIDNFDCEVAYSMNKKNRFRDINTHDLLATVPGGARAEVHNKNFLDNKDLITAVHTRKIKEDSLDIEVETATTSSIKGQEYSNFLTGNRQSTKAKKTDDTVSMPTVTYNIYKAKGYTSNMLDNSNKPLKMRKTRGIKRIDADEEYYQYHRTIDDSVDIFYNPDDEGEPHESEFSLNLGDLAVSEKKPKARKSKVSECSSQFEVIDLSDVSSISNDKTDKNVEFSQVLNISNILTSEGYTFQQFDACFNGVETFNFEEEIDQIRSDERFEVKELRLKQYLIDGTKYFNHWNPDKIELMETTVVIVLSHVAEKQVNVLINSTIAENLSKHSLEFWENVISNADSVWCAVQTISTELVESSGIIERMKLASSFYGLKTMSELVHSPEEWTNQLEKKVFPNLHDHDFWTIASEILNIGTRVEWSALLEMLDGTRSSETRHCITKDTCHACEKSVPGHLLHSIQGEGNRVECGECLRSKFYKEFSAGRIPIDFDSDTASNLADFPAFVPLTILNLYIRALAKAVYKDVGIESRIEKCPQCRSLIVFENKDNQNLSCPCGYCWCLNCKASPHWPMTCKEYNEWKKKWDLRYNLKTAQGTGSDSLMQITCECKSAVFYARLPKETVECPGCKLILKTHTWIHEDFYGEGYWSPNFRRLIERGKADIKTYISRTVHLPYLIKITKINKIPNIKSSVIQICQTGRVIRFDLDTRNHYIKREKQMIRENLLEKEVLEHLRTSTAYLAEFISGWMYETGYSDKKLTQLLESLMANRHLLIEALEDENKEQIRKKIEKLSKIKDMVIEMVNKKLQMS